MGADALDRSDVGPQVGEPMPEFALPDEKGRLVTLSSLLRSGPAVISVNRGHWCPYCKLDLRSLAADARPALQVPSAAVVYTGPRRLVFVDLGEGRFRPREVQVGAQSNGMTEVLAGLSAGDRVATSGVFLIAAEARISTAAKYWDAPDPMLDEKSPLGRDPKSGADQ